MLLEVPPSRAYTLRNLYFELTVTCMGFFPSQLNVFVLKDPYVISPGTANRTTH